jgi:hypothetical protein
VALLVRLPGGSGRLQGDSAQDPVEPIAGDPGEIAGTLRAFAREGIAHVQLVLDPITLRSIQAIAPVLSVLEGG